MANIWQGRFPFENTEEDGYRAAWLTATAGVSQGQKWFACMHTLTHPFHANHFANQIANAAGCRKRLPPRKLRHRDRMYMNACRCGHAKQFANQVY